MGMANETDYGQYAQSEEKKENKEVETKEEN